MFDDKFANDLIGIYLNILNNIDINYLSVNDNLNNSINKLNNNIIYLSLKYPVLLKFKAYIERINKNVNPKSNLLI